MKKTTLLILTLSLAMLIALNGVVFAADFVEGLNVDRHLYSGLYYGDYW